MYLICEKYVKCVIVYLPREMLFLFCGFVIVTFLGKTGEWKKGHGNIFRKRLRISTFNVT